MKIIEHGRQRLAQLAVHEMPLPAIWHTDCQAGTTESTIPRAMPPICSSEGAMRIGLPFAQNWLIWSAISRCCKIDG